MHVHLQWFEDMHLEMPSWVFWIWNKGQIHARRNKTWLGMLLEGNNQRWGGVMLLPFHNWLFFNNSMLQSVWFLLFHSSWSTITILNLMIVKLINNKQLFIFVECCGTFTRQAGSCYCSHYSIYKQSFLHQLLFFLFFFLKVNNKPKRKTERARKHSHENSWKALIMKPPFIKVQILYIFQKIEHIDGHHRLCEASVKWVTIETTTYSLI